MKRSCISVTLLIAILLAGCSPWCGTQYHAKRQDQQTLSAQDVTSFHIRTCFGDIHLTGSDTTECHVEAQIKGHARSQERAQILADTTQVVLEKNQGRLELYLDKPPLEKNESVGASFTIQCPRSLALDGKTSYGNIDVKTITGDVTAKTSFGNIDLKDITGPLTLESSYGNIHGHNLDTPEVTATTSFANIELQGRPSTYPVANHITCTSSYGNINCRDLAAQVFRLKTSFANATLDCGPQTPADVQIDVNSSYGNVTCKLKDHYAGSVHLSTSFGDIHSHRDVLTRGVHKDRLKGTIGIGNGRLECHTSFGNMQLK